MVRCVMSALAVLVGLSGCARSDIPLPDLPDLSLSGAPGGEIENRVWLDTDPGAAQGSFVAFLSDGSMIADSCGELWRLSPWRRIDETHLVWEEDGVAIKAEIALVGATDLALVLDLTSGTTTRRFRAAEAPMVCPETR